MSIEFVEALLKAIKLEMSAFHQADERDVQDMLNAAVLKVVNEYPEYL